MSESMKAMPDYILREDAYNALCSICVDSKSCDRSDKSACHKEFADIPAADVRENVCGRWIKKGRWYCCSECGHDMIFTGTYDDEQRYCSWCGADMRGKKDE